MLSGKKIGLLPKVILAIILGVACSLFMPLGIARCFETINSLFSNYLGFVIPLIILGLVAPSIGDLGGRAGRLLIFTALLAYGSTIFSGYLSYFVSTLTFPSLLQGESLAAIDVAGKSAVAPYFTVEMPALLSVTSALVLAFVLGLTLANCKGRGQTIAATIKEFKDLVMIIIEKSIIPLLPLYIFGIFLKLGVEGEVAMVLGLFIKVILLIFAMHIALLLIQFCLAGAVAGRNPLRALVTMLPAYLTALGTQSSAATIPVTLAQTKLNGVRDDIAEFVVPLCATIHLSGSILKIVACTLAIAWSTGMPIDLELYTSYILMLGITMVAAPGVPGGAIMAALALLTSLLGFSETQLGLMIALYIAMDSFGTAGNVTGDGAIAMVVNRFVKE
ncbi:MAG: dicarboxylate/amino acid:cation symporter [Rikenellaceae bacterium]